MAQKCRNDAHARMIHTNDESRLESCQLETSTSFTQCKYLDSFLHTRTYTYTYVASRRALVAARVLQLLPQPV